MGRSLSRRRPDPGDRDQRMQAEPDVMVLGGEVAIHHLRAEIDAQSSA